MEFQIGLFNSENQITVFKLDTEKKEISNIIIDALTLPEQKLDLLLISSEEIFEQHLKILSKEEKYYPIFPASLFTEQSKFEYEELFTIHQKALNRWTLANNMETVEQVYPLVNHLKDLYIKDRNTFFEELWFVFKRNLATSDLQIIFHDLKEVSEKQKEKGEKPTLCYSVVRGSKVPNLEQGKSQEEMLMKEYEKEFNTQFEITEYDSSRGQLVACSKIGLSPILILAKLPGLNQLQKSLLTGVFKGF